MGRSHRPAALPVGGVYPKIECLVPGGLRSKTCANAIYHRETIPTVSERQPSPRQRFLTGLIGAPIARSASPAMHEQAAAALGLRCHYQLIEVAGADRAELRALLDGARRLGFAGVNVTFPYKEAVVDLLDDLSPGAAAVGAVNTIVVGDGRLVGYNTDTTGFARAARDLVADSRHGAVAVIGAGGVGKAIAYALAGLGVAEIRIFDTDRSKADHLAGLQRARGNGGREQR